MRLLTNYIHNDTITFSINKHPSNALHYQTQDDYPMTFCECWSPIKEGTGPDKLKDTASEIIEIYFYQSHAKPFFRVSGKRDYFH